MTVGSPPGDTGGDLATPTPVKVPTAGESVSAPEWLTGSRFWMLQSSDDEDNGEEDGDEGKDEDMAGSVSFFCRSPSPASDADLHERSEELARRHRKRIQRRDNQRMATRAALLLSATEGTSPFPSPTLPLGSNLGARRKASPVLEPTVFFDDDVEGWTVVRRRRWSPASDEKIRDPRKEENSKKSDVGFVRLRAGVHCRSMVAGPNLVRHRKGLGSSRFNGDQGPRLAKVGNAVAGHAFRNLLGLAWKRCESGAPVVRWRRAGVPMNGDGGRGGFNPGHGGFHAGRGGMGQGRGGYGNSRGAFAARGRYNQGGVRGGHGYGPGRGYQGNNANVRGGHGYGPDRTFFQGESSNSVGRGAGHGDDSWEGPNGNYQRGNNYSSNNRFAYGGNQQRWNTGRGGGYVNRPRATGTEARNGIDAELLQQTVQAVVAAVTAATKVSEPPAMRVTQVAYLGQEAQVIQEAGAKGKDNEVQGPPPKKKEDKAGCFRCKQPGHYIDDCPMPFCDICESIHHATTACHLLNAPKPTAILHGYANEALMFVELPCGAFKAKAENPKLAKVIVDGDAMTIPQLIEQLKKIVPSEKFNWEVFHFKDNVYRVKLPSKLEVQRLNNFGTYICTDRESHLTFDLWSSLEDPLYMLPEVWVRVLGLQSDIISDYLSLWGVGTLFGKTLDVDMAYTRKNKVLRIKIGCLDRNLIPEDCDMFIRRGFFKLHFEVEVAHQSQEVNMMDATNGNDGNDDAHDGEGKDSGGHTMDMETKGNDLDGPSNTDEQEESNMNNDVDGMQEQLCSLEAIQIGTMRVTLSPSGSPSCAKNLNKKELNFKPLSYVDFLTLNDEPGTLSGADLRPRGSALGSSPVSAGDRRRQPPIGQQVAGVQPLSHAADSGSAPVEPATGQREDSGLLLSPGANGTPHAAR
ncbi:hypothetical protein ACQ4PT_017525 [Festuca glaucescens]